MRISNLKSQISNKIIICIALLGIAILASVLRFYLLGLTPNGLDWDEASLGYNAYSILHTGRDEFNTFLPIVLKSFGDYKPALYAYLAIPSVAVFGLTPFSVRLPSAVFGVLTVLLVYFLVEEMFRKKGLAVASAFFLALSPWHIQFSRVAFETNVGVFFNVLGALLFLKGLKRPWMLILAAIAFALNLYVYQSEKVFTPLLAVLLIVLNFEKIVKLPKKIHLTTIIVGLSLVLPISLYTFTSPSGIARAQGVSIFSDQKLNGEITRRYEYNKMTGDKLGLVLDNKRIVYAKQIVGNYLSHFSPNWLFITGDISRHHAPNMGHLYLWELPFVGIGIYQLFFGRYSKKTKLFLFGWLLLAPLPASITQDVPHAVRTMNMVVSIEVFAALGFVGVLEWIGKQKFLLGGFLVVLSVVAVYNFAYYIDQYFVQQNYFNSLDWQYGYSQIVSETTSLAPGYQHVVVDSQNQFSQSYIFYLFFGKIDPLIYQQAGNIEPSKMYVLGKYTFRKIDWAKDQAASNTLFVGSQGNFPAAVQGVQKIVYNVDGNPLAVFVGK